MLESIANIINIIPWYVYFGLAWMLNAVYLRKINSTKQENPDHKVADRFAVISVDVYMFIGLVIYICSIMKETSAWWVGLLTVLVVEILVILYWNLMENQALTGTIVLIGKYLKPILFTLAAFGAGLLYSVFLIASFFILILFEFSMQKNR